jgi:hypothetical protein
LPVLSPVTGRHKKNPSSGSKAIPINIYERYSLIAFPLIYIQMFCLREKRKVNITHKGSVLDICIFSLGALSLAAFSVPIQQVVHMANGPICRRPAIHRAVIVLSCRNRAAMATISRSPLARERVSKWDCHILYRLHLSTRPPDADSKLHSTSPAGQAKNWRKQ